jgi:hypothetical protein
MIAQSDAEVTELNRLAAQHMAKARKAAGGVFCQRRGPLGGPPVTGIGRPDERTRGSIQLPGLMLGCHSAALSEASSSR